MRSPVRNGQRGRQNMDYKLWTCSENCKDGLIGRKRDGGSVVGGSYIELSSLTTEIAKKKIGAFESGETDDLSDQRTYSYFSGRYGQNRSTAVQIFYCFLNLIFSLKDRYFNQASRSPRI